ncbi:hypothetical protein HMPREF1623_00545 [Escherichia coli 910096-2]|nr:hypothetical protein HMPREF1623_00545 [Escherichia coli 910096-2]
MRGNAQDSSRRRPLCCLLFMAVLFGLKIRGRKDASSVLGRVCRFIVVGV